MGTERHLPMNEDLRRRVTDLQEQADVLDAEAEWHKRHGTLEALRAAVTGAQALRRESYALLRRALAPLCAEVGLPIKYWDWDTILGSLRVEFCEPFEAEGY